MPLPIQAEACCMFAIMLRWVSIAPLATPVVPPVYCRNARSSGPISTFGNVPREPAASASLKRTAFGSENGGTSFLTYLTTTFVMNDFGKPRRSPSALVMTCSHGVPSMTDAVVCAKLSSTRSARAPESTS